MHAFRKKGIGPSKDMMHAQDMSIIHPFVIFVITTTYNHHELRQMHAFEEH